MKKGHLGAAFLAFLRSNLLFCSGVHFCSFPVVASEISSLYKNTELSNRPESVLVSLNNRGKIGIM